MKNKKAENAITAVLAAAVLVTGGMSLHSYLSEQRAKNEYDAIRQEVVAEPAAGETQEEIAEKNYPELQIDFAELIRNNPDFRGWLYFPALDISYPVVQGEDNDYYLKHSFEGESVNAGCIFMDCGASADWSDRNTFVFGHNMRDESMFGAFKNLLKGTASCEENPYFYIRKIKSTFMRFFPIMKQRVPVTVLPRLPQMPPMMIMCSGPRNIPCMLQMQT